MEEPCLTCPFHAPSDLDLAARIPWMAARTPSGRYACHKTAKVNGVVGVTAGGTVDEDSPPCRGAAILTNEAAKEANR